MAFVLEGDLLYKMFEDIPSEEFDLTAPVMRDRSLKNYQMFSYDAKNANERGRIDLQIQDTSLNFLPHEGYIEVEGMIKRVNPAGNYAADAKVGFVNNGIMALFESANYLIDGKEIESIQSDLGVVTNILGLARYSDDYQRTIGPSMMFHKDTSDKPESELIKMGKVRNATGLAETDAVIKYNTDYNLGYAARKAMLEGDARLFSCMIPLSHIFGFCRDVKKVIYGVKHTVMVHRKTDDDAIWRVPADVTTEAAKVADRGEVVLTKLTLWMPALTPSIEEENKLINFMNMGGTTLLSWYDTTVNSFGGPTAPGLFTWQITSQRGLAAPKHIFVALQYANKINDQTKNPMTFDRLGVSRVSLRVNGHDEPSEAIDIDYAHNKFARVYQRLASYMAHDQNVDTGMQISQREFYSLYPIYYFSLEHMDLTKQSVVNLVFRAQVGEGGYRAIEVILSNKAMIMEGVGGRMKVLDAPIEIL